MTIPRKLKNTGNSPVESWINIPMLLAILTLLAGLLISGVAIFYSVAGLTNIFAAAVVPIIVMGTSLELAKLVATVWLKQNWNIAPKLLKAYLLVAVVVLMMITSMGIFGFLSKAHSDQSLISGDVQSKIVVYDEKIKTARDNIDANRKALQQMDAQVDQLLGRTTDDKGANRAVQVRRQQKAERARLQSEIAAEQEAISKLNEEAAPIRAQVRKVEAEVGPIKYIAALIYGDQASTTMLENAVRWVIIMIVVVFDPLAITLLLASQYSFQELARQRREKAEQAQEDKFVETFLESKGSVDPEINLEFDEPEIPEPVIEPEPEPVIEEDVRDVLQQIEDRTAEDNQVIDPELEASKTRIIHTKEGMIIQDSAGTQEIVTTPYQPEVIAIDKNYISVDGQVFHHRAYKPESSDAHQIITDLNNTTYVQNEEQQESNKWSNVLGTITEDRYLEAAQERQKKASE